MANLKSTMAVLNVDDQRRYWLSDLHSGNGLAMVAGSSRANLESSLDSFFTKAKQYAYAAVIRRLDPTQSGNDKAYLLCSSCLGALWKGHPIQEELLGACHSYTSQWLSERDTSWLVNSIPAVKAGLVNEQVCSRDDLSLIKAVGAWSLDVERGSARDVLLSSGRVDTVSRGEVSLVCDAMDRSSSDPRLGVPGARRNAWKGGPGCRGSSRSPRNSEKSRTSRAQHVPVMDIEERTWISESSGKTYTEAELASIDEQVETLLPKLIRAIYRRLECQRIFVSTTGSSLESNGNGVSPNSLVPWNGQASGHGSRNFQKRKRGDDEDDRGGESENDGDAPAPRTPNPMPLDDMSARLACQFHTFDKVKYCDGGENGKQYKTCITGFKDSRDLRDHLKKKHCGPKHLCSRCHTEFRDATEKATHEKRMTRCEEGSNILYEQEKYILIGTERRLIFDAMKKPRGTSHEEHWLDTWSVIFPGYPFPTTPYMPQDAFDVTFGRASEEEIQNCVNARRRDRPAGFNEDEEARYLRTFANRLRARLREEFDAGRLCHYEAPTEAVDAVTNGNGVHHDNLRSNQIQADSRQPVPQYTAAAEPVDPDLVADIPPHAHYSPPNWRRDITHNHNHETTHPYDVTARPQPNGHENSNVTFGFDPLDPENPNYDLDYANFFSNRYM